MLIWPWISILAVKCVAWTLPPIQAQTGKKRYQVKLRSQLAPIQVLLINRESSGAKPVVFAVPPPDDISVMPTPPSTPAGLQRCSLAQAASLELCHLKSRTHITPSSSPPDTHMGRAHIWVPGKSLVRWGMHYQTWFMEFCKV